MVKIFKKADEAKEKVEAAPEKVAEQPTVNVCTAPVGDSPCGKPLAPGQTYVCAEHVRTN